MLALVDPHADVAVATEHVRTAWAHVMNATDGIVPGSAPGDDTTPEPDDAAEPDDLASEDPASEDLESDAPAEPRSARGLAAGWLRAHYGDDAHVEGACLPWIFGGPAPTGVPPLPTELRMHALWMQARIMDHLAVSTGSGPLAIGLVALALVLMGAAVFAGELAGLGSPWRAEYYSVEDLTGDPVVDYVDKLEFVYGKGAPLPGLPKDGFSIRFTTCLEVDETTKYSFSLTSDDGSRMRVNGKELIDNWGPHGKKAREGTIELDSGLHLLEVEFFDRRYGAQVKLLAAQGKSTDYKTIAAETLLQPEDGDEPCE